MYIGWDAECDLVVFVSYSIPNRGSPISYSLPDLTVGSWFKLISLIRLCRPSRILAERGLLCCQVFYMGRFLSDCEDLPSLKLAVCTRSSYDTHVYMEMQAPASMHTATHVTSTIPCVAGDVTNRNASPLPTILDTKSGVSSGASTNIDRVRIDNHSRRLIHMWRLVESDCKIHICTWTCSVTPAGPSITIDLACRHGIAQSKSSVSVQKQMATMLVIEGRVNMLLVLWWGNVKSHTDRGQNRDMLTKRPRTHKTWVLGW